jgi:peptidoglycan/xylan/chitin deacetylase (PgdA/CDA1 family)
VLTARSLLPRWAARLSATPAGAVVVYHRVGGETSGDPKREILPPISRNAFGVQLRHLCSAYSVVSAADILEATVRRKRSQRVPVAITFDDDLESHVHEAREALEDAGATATFFLTGTSLAQPHAFWWEDLQRAIDERLVADGALPHIPAPTLDAALARTPKAIFGVADAIMQLRREQRLDVAAALRTAVGPPPSTSGLRGTDVRMLVDSGFDVGFHTVGHEALTLLDDDALAAAMHEGREALADAAGRDIGMIAYPHGLGDDRVARAARDAGFSRGFVTGRSAVRADTDPFLIPRLVPPADPGKLALRIALAVGG